MKLRPEQHVPAWLHGETAFTTVRVQAGRALLWPQHYARLRATCQYLGLGAPAFTLPPLEAWPWSLLRVTVTASGTLHSQRPLSLGPRPEVVSVQLGRWEVHPQLGQHKTGNYLPYRLTAQDAAQHGDFEGWLRCGATLVDGSRTSPLLDFGSGWVQPTGGLPSVTRAAFVQALGRGVTTRPVHLEELENLRRALLCGSGVGVVPVGQLHLPGQVRALQSTWPGTLDPALTWPE